MKNKWMLGACFQIFNARILYEADNNLVYPIREERQ